MQFVEIRGKKQYYLSKGSGEPVVVFVSGLGPPMDNWKAVQNRLSKTTRAICYDRAGMWNSESYGNERTIGNISIELNEFIDALGIQKPVVLVGHSRGGAIIRYFVNNYPGKVSGIVLVDPSNPGYDHLIRQLKTDAEKREFDSINKSYYIDSLQYPKTVRDEFVAVFNNDSIAVSGLKFPPNIPTTIIASNKVRKGRNGKEETRIWVEMISTHKKNNQHIRLLLTDKAGHWIQMEQPKLVSNEIELIVKKLKEDMTHPGK